jgi:hypothetical protein
MTEIEITEIEKRCNKATRGPWISMIEGRDHESGDSFIMTGIENSNNTLTDQRGNDIYLTGGTLDDQDFIAHARQDIPVLISEIRRLNLLLRK